MVLSLPSSSALLYLHLSQETKESRTNAYWRVDYTVRLYKKTDSDNDFNFEIIDVNSIEDAVNKIGDSTQEDVFYAMKCRIY